MSLIYLAGAIDKATSSPIPWVEQLRRALRDFWLQSEKGKITPLLIYSPQAAFWGSMALADRVSAIRIMDVNQMALLRADLLMVKYEPGVETWGTSQEILSAANVQVPILVWYSTSDEPRIDNWPMYITAWLNEFSFPYSGVTAAAQAAVKWLLTRK